MNWSIESTARVTTSSTLKRSLLLLRNSLRGRNAPTRQLSGNEEISATLEEFWHSRPPLHGNHVAPDSVYVRESVRGKPTVHLVGPRYDFRMENCTLSVDERAPREIQSTSHTQTSLTPSVGRLTVLQSGSTRFLTNMPTAWNPMKVTPSTRNMTFRMPPGIAPHPMN